jgi:hypothetical protein
MRRLLCRLGLSLAVLFAASSLRAEGPTFFRGVNLNGPAVTIDGHRWEPGSTEHLVSRDRAFESQGVPLVPPTDGPRARMIRSSRWNNRVDMTLTDLPNDTYSVFVYVWEDNNSEVFSLALNGREVVHDLVSGEAGQWRKLGPWRVVVRSGKIHLTTRGGAANISGVELWKGDGPVPEPGKTPPRDPKVVRFFDEKIAPLLAQHCLECHNRSQRAGGLDLSREEGLLAGGESGEPAIVPKEPDESLLWQYVVSDEMPLDRPPLNAAEKVLLKDWIADGAAWGTPVIDPFTVTNDRRAGYDWWSLQPVGHPAPPAVERDDWPRNAIDRFILARLESKGLEPAPEADRRVLIRRLSFDLTGLPPAPEEVARFVADSDPRAYEKLVDRLLESPHYGERWARHWLAVIRFGESQGFERNRIRENAWRYRDWVVAALNRDMPYDEFVRLQIAGDVLRPDDLGALIATGYHVCGTWDQVGHLEGSAAMQKACRQDEIEDLVATVGQTFLGLTINCARCHDHKFDPISQVEYYQFAALLGGVTQQEKERHDIRLKAGPDQPDFHGVAHVIVPKQPPVFHVLARGNYRNPGRVVAPAALKSLRGLPGDFGLAPDAPEAQRRIRLAQWLTDARNPLTPRVMVNRIWYYHFGEGIVDTPSDFGFNGGRPSHPKLLDYLAARFVESGWKIKALHRLIVTSATYRQASRIRNERAAAIDAENRLRWRADRRRLEGEAVRDAALAVAGALNRKLGGPSYRDVKVDLGNNHTFTTPTGEFSPNTCRRTLYRLWARSGNNPLLESLDCPDPTVTAPRRTQTITPVQALSLMNNAFMEKCAARFAERLRKEAGDEPREQIERAYRLAYGRAPAKKERALARPFIAEYGLEQFCLVLFNANEFLYVD